MNLMKNKRGQVESIILVIVTIFIIGIILFFMNTVNEKLYTALEVNFEGNPDLNATEAHEAVQAFQEVEQGSIWDFAFLAIFIGLMIQMLIFSFASRANIAFFWIFVIIGIISLVLGVMLSNIWQGVAANPEFTATVARFPIMDTLLGSYFPMVVTAFIFLLMIVLFGKFPGQE